MQRLLESMDTNENGKVEFAEYCHFVLQLVRIAQPFSCDRLQTLTDYGSFREAHSIKKDLILHLLLLEGLPYLLHLATSVKHFCGITFMPLAFPGVMRGLPLLQATPVKQSC